MSLVKAKQSLPITYTNPIAELIQRRRLQILVHSCLYYELDDTLINDTQWQVWANELAQLQRENPLISDKVIYAKEFKDFDGSTGYHLPYRDKNIQEIALRLLEVKDSDTKRSITSSGETNCKVSRRYGSVK